MQNSRWTPKDLIILILATGVFFLCVCTPLIRWQQGHELAHTEVIGGIIACLIAVIARYLKDDHSNS